MHEQFKVRWDRYRSHPRSLRSSPVLLHNFDAFQGAAPGAQPRAKERPQLEGRIQCTGREIFGNSGVQNAITVVLQGSRTTMTARKSMLFFFPTVGFARNPFLGPATPWEF